MDWAQGLEIYITATIKPNKVISGYYFLDLPSRSLRRTCTDEARCLSDLGRLLRNRAPITSLLQAKPAGAEATNESWRASPV